VVVNGIAYFGSHDGNVYAVNTANGAIIWRAPTGGKVSGSAAVVSNKVCIVSENGRLFCFNAQTGATNWSALLEANRAPAGSPAIVNGVVFIGAGGLYGHRAVAMSASPIYGFDMNTGAQVWRSVGTGPQGFAAIATDGTNLYAGIGGSSYAAFRISDGATVWTKNEGHQNRQFVSMSVVDGTVYFPGSIRGSVSAYTPAGTRKWFNTTFYSNSIFEVNNGGTFGYEILADIAVAHGRIYAGCNDGALYTFDQATGAKGWTYQTGGKIQSSPAVASNMVYFGSWDGWLYALDARTGALQWKYNAGNRIISAPWVGDGVIYFGCDDGAVYALEAGGPAAQILSATPSSGDAPLAVSFRAQAVAGDAAISNCTWQFGDGTAAAHGPALTNAIHTYESPGHFTAVFAVIDYAGVGAHDSAFIHVVPEGHWHAGIMPLVCAWRCARNLARLNSPSTWL
jgi:outer membrane protein assembly factor BamB